MKPKTVWICAILLGVLFTGICAGVASLALFDLWGGFERIASLSTDEHPKPRVGYQAPEIELNNIDGYAVRLADYLGQPVVVNFWATWCGPCVSEIPDIQAVYNKYDFNFLAVNVGEDRSTVSNFAFDLNLSFPILLDLAGDAQLAYDVDAIPTTFFIDSEGTIQMIERGSMSSDVLQNNLVSIGAIP